MSFFFTCLTINSNLPNSAFDYLKATKVDMSHFHSNRGSCGKGGLGGGGW